MYKVFSATLGIAIFIINCICQVEAAPSSWLLEQRSPYNSQVQELKSLHYTPLATASKAWKVCALVPHLKDAYWIGINYGLMRHAKQLNIHLDLYEANSYYGVSRQLEQLEQCLQADYDAILLGAVAPDILSFYPKKITKPIIALVNQLSSERVNTRVGVNWYQMGSMVGEFIKRNAKQQVQVALLTGPKKVGGSNWVEQGLRAAINDSHVQIKAIRHADNNRNLHRKQLQLQLKDFVPEYIIGSAVAIEASVSLLKQKGLTEKIKLVSTYLSPATLRGLYRGKVIYANDDQVVLQGKLAVDVIVRELEGAKPFGDIGPKIIPLDNNAPAQSALTNSLAPAEFYPKYKVTAN